MEIQNKNKDAAQLHAYKKDLRFRMDHRETLETRPLITDL